MVRSVGAQEMPSNEGKPLSYILEIVMQCQSPFKGQFPLPPRYTWDGRPSRDAGREQLAEEPGESVSTISLSPVETMHQAPPQEDDR